MKKKYVLRNQIGNQLLSGQLNDKHGTFMMGKKKRNVFFLYETSF